MAKLSKNTVDYFPHETVGKKTMYILETDYGNDGYAFWYKLLETLGVTDGHYYNFNDSAAKRYLIAKTKLSENKATEILKLLSDLEAIDKKLWEENKIIWSQNFVDNISSVYKKRNRPIPQKPIYNNGVVTEFPPMVPAINETTDLKKIYNKESIEFMLALFLQCKIKEGNKAFIVKGEKQVMKWAHDIDLMIRIDKRDPREIAYIIKWATEDNFWSGNILSSSKLRKQYAQLWKKAGLHYDKSKPVNIDSILKKGELK